MESPGRAACERTPRPDTEPCPGTAGRKAPHPSPRGAGIRWGGGAGRGVLSGQQRRQRNAFLPLMLLLIYFRGQRADFLGDRGDDRRYQEKGRVTLHPVPEHHECVCVCV